MQIPTAVEALSALAHPSRLAVFRLLVRAGPDGMPAGEIAREVGALPNTLSSNLNILVRAGLARARRESRSILYSADYDGMRSLLGFLMKDCCGGRAEICAPITELAGKGGCP